jgi:hypothetical protein
MLAHEEVQDQEKAQPLPALLGILKQHVDYASLGKPECLVKTVEMKMKSKTTLSQH